MRVSLTSSLSSSVPGGSNHKRQISEVLQRPRLPAPKFERSFTQPNIDALLSKRTSAETTAAGSDSDSDAEANGAPASLNKHAKKRCPAYCDRILYRHRTRLGPKELANHLRYLDTQLAFKIASHQGFQAEMEMPSLHTSPPRVCWEHVAALLAYSAAQRLADSMASEGIKQGDKQSLSAWLEPQQLVRMTPHTYAHILFLRLPLCLPIARSLSSSFSLSRPASIYAVLFLSVYLLVSPSLAACTCRH